VFRRFPPPDPAALATLCGAAALGGLGLLPGAAGALDARTLLGWLALCAPAAGALCGARGLGWFPFALAVPGAWVVALVLLDASAGGVLPTPLWAACALTGLFAAGLAVGKRAGVPLRTMGLLLFLTAGFAGACLGFGLLADGAALARTQPALAARLLDLSPLVLVLDCAGLDWSHAQPAVYAASGVEWFPRRPFPGNLAGPAVLVVGCLLAALVPAPRRGMHET
jgi:hypothetical protein